MLNAKRAASVKERIARNPVFARPEGVRVLTPSSEWVLTPHARAVCDVVLVHIAQGEVRVLHHERAQIRARGCGDEAAGRAETHVRSPRIQSLITQCYLRSPVCRLDRILSAYTDDLPFSIDLVGAVRISVLRPEEREKSDMARSVADHAAGILHLEDVRLWLDGAGVL